MATIRRRGESWVIDYSDNNGKRKVKSLGRISKKEAEKILKDYEYTINKGFNKFSAPQFFEYIEEYLNWYAIEYPASYPRIYQIITQHLLPAFEFFNIADIGGRDVKQYQMQRLATGIKRETYLKELRTLKAMLSRAVEWEIIERNPISHIKGPKINDSRPPHFYTSQELELIYKVSIKHAAPWQFIANTGLRRSEAINLDIKKDVGCDALRVISTETKRTKSGKWREIPLFHGAREALDKINGKTLFGNMRHQSVSRAFATDLKSASLEGSLHSLRHTFCSHLAMSGQVSLQEIKEWAGHSSITTTQRYQHMIKGYHSVPKSTLRL